MIIYLFGKEDFLIQNKLDLLKKFFREKNRSSAVSVFDFEQGVEFEKVERDFHQGGGIFSKKSLIILKNTFSLPDDGHKRIIKLLQEYAQASRDLNAIVVQKEVKNKKSKQHKYLLANSKFQEFPKMDPLRLKKWAMSEFSGRSEGKLSINPFALENLIMLTRGDLWKLNGEIEKMVCFKQEGVILLEDLQVLCQGEAEAKIFDLIDCISQRNKAKAHQLMENLFVQGENEFYIFSMIFFQLRNLVRVKEQSGRIGPNPALISQKLGIHPYVAKKTLARLANFSKSSLKKLFDLAAELDYQVKAGQMDIRSALTYFISKS